MKKIISICILAMTLLNLDAQPVLYGLTIGSSNYGTISKLDVGANSLSAVHVFDNVGTNPTGHLLHASDGKLYGLTSAGGASNAGVIFSFDPSTSALTRLKEFNGDDGSQPQGSLIQASDGKLYGLTLAGGANGYGVLFSFDPSDSVYTKLIDFENTNRYPQGSLIQATDGKLYGMTSNGGTDDVGTIFSFDPSVSVYTELTDFDNTNGANPYGSLIQALDGKLYGMTTYGGVNNTGVIFSFDLSGSIYTKLNDFDNTNGANPYGSLLQTSDGKMYGTTNQGGAGGFGVIFSFDTSGSIYTKLADFDNTNGANPYCTLIQASDGKLYGVTYIGGADGTGVIFSFDLADSVYTKVEDLDNVGGQYGYRTELTQFPAGTLYGITYQGGNSGSGVLFSFDLSTSALTKVNDFDGINGKDPWGSLLQASDGKLYGVTNSSGLNGYGLIFSFDPLSSKYTKLMDFDNANGAYPTGSLIQASNGKLYGMTEFGGSYGFGTLFSFDPSTSVYVKLMNFDDIIGGYPYGCLMLASDGKLYGMTSEGGTGGYGVIFSFDPSTSVYAELKDFDNINGSYPEGSLMQASNGKLYGMTPDGGTNNSGVIFSFDPSTSSYAKLYDFDNTNGAYPYNSLIQALDGKLYGMTPEGEADCGVIFSFDPSTFVYTKLHDFDYTNGGNPAGNLLQASDGKLYGMTPSGGADGDGVIFSFDLPGLVYTKVKDFDGVNGENPYLGSLIELCTSTTSVTKQPLATQTICLNAVPANLIVTVNGTGLSYKWYADNDNSGFDGTAVSGGINSSFTPPTVTAGTFYYYVVIKGTCGTVTSAYAKVIVNASPVITASTCSNGSITPSGSTTVNCGGSQKYTITPAACYHITGVLVDGVSNTAAVGSGSYTFTNVQANHTISATFTANPAVNAGTISCSPTVCVGSTNTFTSNGTSGGSWSSSNTVVAKINASTGVVTGMSAGTATIKYAVTNGCSSKYTTKDITVVSAPNAGTLNCSPTVCVGSTTPVTSNGNSGGSWSSSNILIAKVNTSTGVVTGVKAGTATITYTVTNSCSSKNAVKSITVAAGTPTVTGHPGSPFTRNVGTSCNYAVSGTEFNATATCTCGVPTLSYSLSGATSGTGASLTDVKLNKGTTTITWKAVMGSLTSSCSITVNVYDKQPPSISCKKDATKTVTGSSYTIAGAEFDATASDNCGTPSLIYCLSGKTVSAYSPLNTTLATKKLNIGATTITWKATDGSGNVSTCTTVVTVSNPKSLVSNETMVSMLPADKQVAEPELVPFTVKVMPNPTSNYFTLQLNSQSYEKLTVSVIDVSGRVIEQKADVPANSTLQLGNAYHPGIYIAHIFQGKNKVVIRLIKEGH